MNLIIGLEFGDEQGADVTGAGQMKETGGGAESRQLEADELQEELASARGKVDELEKELGIREGSISDQAEHYRRGLEVMRSDQARIQEELEEAARKQRKTEFDLSFQEQAARTQVERFREEITLLQQQLEGGSSERGELREEARRLRGSLEEADRSMEHLQQVVRERDLQIGQQLEELKRVHDEPTTAQGDIKEDVAALYQELEQAMAGRRAAEAEVGRLEQAAADTDSEALKEELDTLTRALDESNRLREETTRRAQRLEAELNAQGVVSGRDEVTVIKKLRRQKETAEEKVRQLEAEAQRMRSVMEQYVEQIQAVGSAGAESGDLGALHSELQLVRDRAEADLARMKDEMEELRSRLEAQELTGSAEAAENQLLRQEVDQLHQQMEQQKEKLEQATREKLRLQEQIEERNSEIDRLGQALDMVRVESEEADFKRREEVDARKQLEAALYKSQEELEHRLGQELTGGDRSSGPEGGAGGKEVGGRQRVIFGALAGAVLAFAVAEGLSIMSGRGEILSGSLARSGSSSAAARAVKPELRIPRKTRADLPQQTAGQPSSNLSPPVTGVAVGKPSGSASLAMEAVNRLAAGTIVQDWLAGGGRGPVMVYLWGGEFSMGSERDQLALEEQPAHRVEVKDFAIGKYEVTFDEYQRFARATGRSMPDGQDWGKGRRPVINVTQEDAVAYTRWLSRQSGQHYRLPTEAEWEYAAAGGTDSYYWWGYELGEGNANCFNCGSRWDEKSTAPVGSFKANPYGLHDMAGNVMEWVQDCHHPDYRGAPADGSAWLKPGCEDVVVRGGGFNKPEDTLRTTKRSRHHRSTRLPVLGFRVVRDVR